MDRSEGEQIVIPLAVAPAVPARILAFLQDVHLTTEVHLLKTNKATDSREREREKEWGGCVRSVKMNNLT